VAWVGRHRRRQEILEEKNKIKRRVPGGGGGVLVDNILFVFVPWTFRGRLVLSKRYASDSRGGRGGDVRMHASPMEGIQVLEGPCRPESRIQGQKLVGLAQGQH